MIPCERLGVRASAAIAACGSSKFQSAAVPSVAPARHKNARRFIAETPLSDSCTVISQLNAYASRKGAKTQRREEERYGSGLSQVSLMFLASLRVSLRLCAFARGLLLHLCLFAPLREADPQ